MIIIHVDTEFTSNGYTIKLIFGFVPFGKTVQECKDLLQGDLVDGSITEFFDIPLNDGPVGSHRIFLLGLVVIDPDFGCF